MVWVAVFQRNLLFASSEDTVKMDVSSEQYPFEVILCLVTVLPQGNVKLHFDLFFTAYFNGGCRGVAKLRKNMIAASAGRSVIVAGSAQQCGSLLV